MKIGFAYNRKEPSTCGTDEHAEYETDETIEAIESALSMFGEVIRLPCDRTFIKRITANKPDMIFNIAEGWGSRDRESFVPVVAQMMDIPYSGSDAVALGITMDKALTKAISRDAGIRTAPFIIYNEKPDSPPPFGFPVFVKPNEDGSSRGISKGSLVTTMELLRDRVTLILDEYRQPALAEPYLDGRDFCVGLLGNDHPLTLPACEVLLGHEDDIPFFSFEYKRHDTDRLDFTPDVSADTIADMENMAHTAWNILGLRDYARMDFRTDSDGIPYLLEINALPGLSPVSGIFVRQAGAVGITYNTLIHRIAARTLTLA